MNNVQIIQPELENFLILEKLTKNEYKSSTQAASIEVLLAQAKQKDAQ